MDKITIVKPYTIKNYGLGTIIDHSIVIDSFVDELNNNNQDVKIMETYGYNERAIKTIRRFLYG